MVLCGIMKSPVARKTSGKTAKQDEKSYKGILPVRATTYRQLLDENSHLQETIQGAIDQIEYGTEDMELKDRADLLKPLQDLLDQNASLYKKYEEEAEKNAALEADQKALKTELALVEKAFNMYLNEPDRKAKILLPAPTVRKFIEEGIETELASIEEAFILMYLPDEERWMEENSEAEQPGIASTIASPGPDPAVSASCIADSTIASQQGRLGSVATAFNCDE